VVIADGYRNDAAVQVRRALLGVLDVLRATTPDARVGLMLAEGAAAPELLHASKDEAALRTRAGAFVESGTSAPLLVDRGGRAHARRGRDAAANDHGPHQPA
jgi:hypothetical protein